MQGLPSSSSSLVEEGSRKSLHTSSLCWPLKPVGTTGQIQYVIGLIWYVPCKYIAHSCSYSVFTSSYIVHGYYWLFAYTTTWYARIHHNMICPDTPQHDMPVCATGKLTPLIVLLYELYTTLKPSWNMYITNGIFLYDSIVHPYYKGCTHEQAVVYLKAVL